MSFSLPRFVRRTQSSDLQRYFAARGILFSEQVEWTAKPAALLDSMKVAIESLPERERERVFEDFERIDQLSDDIGQRALQSVIDHNEAFLRQFHSCNGSEARGLFVLLTDEEAFDNALATAYAERMRHGRSWSGYCLPAPLAPSKNLSDIALLEADLSALFHQFDGTGRKLKIESFERRTADFPGDPCRHIIHYSVYVEGLPECSFEFERDVPKRRTRRPVIEAAICCDPVTGMLDVVSKGGRPLRENIAKSFAHHLLDSETTLVPVSRRDFGDAYIGGTELAVVFAIGICSQPNLSALATALSVAPPVDFGVVLTTSVAPPRPLRLPHGYEFLELREIARAGKDCLAIEKTKLAGWIKGLRKGLDKPVQLHVGRPSDATLVHQIFRQRRAQALPLVNQRAEAGEIRDGIALNRPERKPPAVKTIESHLRLTSKAKSG